MVGLKVLKRKHEDRDEQIRVAEVPISGALNVQKDCDPYVSVEIALRGLNVKPYFADLLVSGVKDIECRKYILGTHGTARTTFVIRSKGADKGAVSSGSWNGQIPWMFWIHIQAAIWGRPMQASNRPCFCIWMDGWYTSVCVACG